MINSCFLNWHRDASMLLEVESMSWRIIIASRDRLRLVSCQETLLVSSLPVSSREFSVAGAQSWILSQVLRRRRRCLLYKTLKSNISEAEQLLFESSTQIWTSHTTAFLTFIFNFVLSIAQQASPYYHFRDATAMPMAPPAHSDWLSLVALILSGSNRRWCRRQR